MNVPMDVPTDERLIEAALSGDDEAFTELVRKHKRKVMKIAARFAKNDFELDDVCQEIFIKVYKNLKEYRNDAPFEHWLSKIAVNACYDLLRKRYRDGDNIRLDDISMLKSDLAAEEIPAGVAWEVLNHALERLRPEERLVVTLLNLEEKSVREISALTGWSEANVKVRAFRARKELKRILEDTHGKRSQ